MTIDASGNVQRVDVDNTGEKVSGLLQNSAVENMKRWKFSKPPTAPNMQLIVLPGRVNIFMNDPMIDTRAV